MGPELAGTENYQQLENVGLHGDTDTLILDKYECKPGYKIMEGTDPIIYSATILDDENFDLVSPDEFCRCTNATYCETFRSGCYCQVCDSGYRAFNGQCVAYCPERADDESTCGTS